MECLYEFMENLILTLENMWLYKLPESTKLSAN